ncbi:MAG TPA: CAAX prenyl protease-related protein [Tepidisphaeraceae bacterium]|jgi:CAAX prenyl protease-like protein|nr:CAAX prenyl protease-related protein [Tepidisphaeraceae bacterium]
MTRPPTVIDYETQPPARDSDRRDDLAYIAPMGAFMLFTWLGGHWPQFYPASYVFKTSIVPLLLIYFWKRYTKIRWTHLWLGAIVGVLGIVQWVGMEKLLWKLGWTWATLSVEPFDPTKAIENQPLLWSFIAIRWAGATLLVPVMEELFWRDYAWRTIIAPNDFKLASVGEWDPRAYFIVPAIFAFVHVQWLTAIVWALMIGALLVRTKSLGACIIAHAVTNFLLGAYVLWTKEWIFW